MKRLGKFDMIYVRTSITCAYIKEFKAEIASLRREWTSTLTDDNF